MTNGSTNPKLTVIIPTRERCEVIASALKTITSQDYDNLQILVSDNFSSDDTKDVVLAVDDSRIKYINTGKRLGMTGNYEFALSHVNEGWVTLIGDDDGLLPGVLGEVADIIRSTDVEAIKPNVCKYSWPGIPNNEGPYGRLRVPLPCGGEIRNTRQYLSKVMSGTCDYTELPMLYDAGFINTSAIAKVKKQSGNFYRSVNPDLYSSIAISSVIRNYMYLRDPLGISGSSPKSTGLSFYFTRRDDLSVVKKSQLTPIQQFMAEDNIPFHKDLPLTAQGSLPPSGQALVYECFLQASFLFGGNQETTPLAQLEIILANAQRDEVLIATAKGNERPVKEWAVIFAAHHSLDLASVEKEVARRKMADVMFGIKDRLVRELNTYEVSGAREFPITDVYQASIAAAAIRNMKPSRANSLHRIAKRVGGNLMRGKKWSAR
jgi:glycosyltransferase involved in cell wall biosynthesis